MPHPVTKKNCKKCNTVFLTRDKDLEYCNSDCQHRQAYEEHFNVKKFSSRKTQPCWNCGDESTSKFCNNHCLLAYDKKQTLKNNKKVFLADKRKNCKLLPYDVLNKIEEKKRVFDDSWWHYNKKRERI